MFSFFRSKLHYYGPSRRRWARQNYAKQLYHDVQDQESEVPECLGKQAMLTVNCVNISFILSLPWKDLFFSVEKQSCNIKYWAFGKIYSSHDGGMRPLILLMKVLCLYQEEQYLMGNLQTHCGDRRLPVSSVDSLEAVYLYMSVQGYFRNEFCEDVKKIL